MHMGYRVSGCKTMFAFSYLILTCLRKCNTALLRTCYHNVWKIDIQDTWSGYAFKEAFLAWYIAIDENLKPHIIIWNASYLIRDTKKHCNLASNWIYTTRIVIPNYIKWNSILALKDSKHEHQFAIDTCHGYGNEKWWELDHSFSLCRISSLPLNAKKHFAGLNNTCLI